MAVKSTDFIPSQFATFSPEVQAALKANDAGQNNVIQGGVITQRDPNFTYGVAPTNIPTTSATGGLQMPAGYAASSPTPAPTPSTGLQMPTGAAAKSVYNPATGQQEIPTTAIPASTAGLNVNTSIVDYLKSVGQDSSYANRANLAVSLGIINYTGTSEQNIKMLQMMKNQAPTAPITSPIVPTSAGGLVATSDQMRAKEKADEQAKKDAEAKALADQQAEITSLTGKKTVAELKASLGITEAPEPISLVSTYETLRSTAGISGLEGQINTLNQTIRDTEASLRQGLYNEEGKLRPMELISGRQQELKRQGQETLDQLNRDKQTLVDEYTTKTNLVSNIMNLTSQDYTNATNAYNTQFTQAVQLQDLINADRTFEQNQANIVADTARANLTVLRNVVKDSGKDWGELDSSLQTQIQNLELKAGLPQGITKLVADAVPDGKILTTTSRQEASGAAYYDTLVQNPDGSMQVVSTYKGQERLPVGDGNEPAITKAQGKATIVSAWENEKAIQGNGKISSKDYQEAKATWVADWKLKAEDFDTIFNSYIDKSGGYWAGDYGLKIE
jgi:hypothetical protein